jgi:SP family xylose:H+ symportor-like MFS transporter
VHDGRALAGRAASGIAYRSAYIWMIATVAALGGLLFGYDWVVIGGAKPFYETYFQLHSAELVGWANSCALLGCLIGSMMSGLAADRYGRKPLLIVSAFLFAASSVLTGWAPTFPWFVVWRICGGVAIGMASNVSPLYIAEISPAAWRGRLVALNQLTIVVGILAAQVVNWLIADPVPENATAEMIRLSWNGQAGWRWMFTAVAAPALVFFAGAWIVPESPRWLLRRGRREAARKTLERIGGEAHAARSLAEIEETLHAGPDDGGGWAQLRTRGMGKILLIGVGLAVLQQWCGINVIFNYAEEIYRGAGYGISGMLFNVVITGVVNLVFTLVALRFVDRAGRRFLMLAGCGGLAVSHLLIGFAYRAQLRGATVLVLTLCTIGCYAMTLAPVTWVLISEIFPNRVRGAAVSVSVSALWIASFFLTYTFPLLERSVGQAGTFWTYSGICAAGFVFVHRLVRETKGKTLEEIERGYDLPA